MYVMYVYYFFLLPPHPSPSVVSTAEMAAEPESAGTSAQVSDACQDPGNVFIVLRQLSF